jgi:Calcineurin-like phosphoesterase
MTRNKYNPGSRDISRIWAICIIICILLFFAFEVYVLQMQQKAGLPTPQLWGNFPRVRNVLTNAPRKEKFSFAVAGDRQGTGIYPRIVEELRKNPVDFTVMLGDAFTGSPEDHQYFRAQLADEYALPFPGFYIIGNHEVENMSVSRFEELYGPTIFSFEYQNCLFIGLRSIGDSLSDRDSIAFLKSLLEEESKNYRKRFVFLHIPPPVPSFDNRKYTAPKELISLFRRLNVDYVFSGHYHGYARTRYGDTTYIVSGGAGAHLDDDIIPQFHHAVVVEVGEDYVAERIIQVPKKLDLKNKLKKYAIAEAYPYFLKYKVIVYIINLILLVVLIFSIRYSIFKKGRGGESKEAG